MDYFSLYISVFLISPNLFLIKSIFINYTVQQLVCRIYIFLNNGWLVHDPHVMQSGGVAIKQAKHLP